MKAAMTIGLFHWEFEPPGEEQKIHLLTWGKKAIIMSGQEIKPRGTGGALPLSLLQPLESASLSGRDQAGFSLMEPVVGDKGSG